MNGSGIIEEIGMLTGSSVQYRPPQPIDRVPLMEKAFQRAQEVSNPEDAAIILGLAITAVHPYNDGNGRTSRLVYSLLQHGYNGSDEDKSYYTAILQNTKGRDIINLDPSLAGIDRWQTGIMAEKAAKEIGYVGNLPTYEVRAYGDAFAGELTPADLVVNADISEEGRNKLHLAIADNNIQFAIPQILRLMHEKGIEPNSYIRNHTDGRCVIDGGIVVKSLTESDIDNLYGETHIAKRLYVENMINMSGPSLESAKEFYRPKINR
jgi:hypothetical protein